LNAVEQAIIPENAESKIKQVNGTRFRLVDLYGKDLYFFLSGVSMVNAALTIPMAIDHFQLDAIIFSGIAGAVDPKLKPGGCCDTCPLASSNRIGSVKSRFRQTGKLCLPRRLPTEVWSLRYDFSK